MEFNREAFGVRPLGKGEGRDTAERFYECLRENYVIRLLQSIKPLFPEDSNLKIRDCYNDYCLLIDWELPEIKSGRPVRSRTINLLIEKDAIEGFISDSRPAWRRLVEIRLRQFVARKMKFFNPVPDPSMGAGQEELWVVTGSILRETG
ncbi:MAG TPA: hypothetical protein PKN05_10510 [Syntrophales bacterium]|nr:hypothetical protein [Syntrophales bacterium]